MSKLKITRRIPMETYGYYELEFDSIETFEQNFKAIKKTIKEQEAPESKPVDVQTQGNFIKKINKQ